MSFFFSLFAGRIKSPQAGHAGAGSLHGQRCGGGYCSVEGYLGKGVT